MVTSAEVKKFLRDTCEVEVAGIAPAPSFSAGDKKAISCLETAATDEDQLVSSHASWAIETIKGL